HRRVLHARAGAEVGAGNPAAGVVGAGAHHRLVRADLPDGRPDSQTLVVALYYAVFAAGVRAPQSVDAMAMVYMVVTLAWLLIALRFVDPTQLVSRVNEPARR